MKQLHFLAAFLFAACITDTLQGQSATDESAMRAFARDFMAAYNRQDIAALQAMFTTDAVTTSNGAQGIEQIGKAFEDRFTREDVTLLVHLIGVTWSDAEHALVVTGTYERFGITFVYDIPFHSKAAYRNIMVQENGQWKIAKSEVTSVVNTFIYQKIGELADWKSALCSALQGSGVLTIDIGMPHGEPNTAYALLEWPSLEVAQAFFDNPDWQKGLPQADGDEKPVVVFLDEN